MGLVARFLSLPRGHLPQLPQTFRPAHLQGSTQLHSDKDLLRGSPNTVRPPVAQSGLQQGDLMFWDRIVPDVVGRRLRFLIQVFLCFFQGGEVQDALQVSRQQDMENGDLQADKGEGDAPPLEVFQELPEPQHDRVVDAADVAALQDRTAWR